VNTHALARNRRIKKDVLEGIVIKDIEESIFTNRENIAQKILDYYK